jgi:hypothetical protein
LSGLLFVSRFFLFRHHWIREALLFEEGGKEEAAEEPSPKNSAPRSLRFPPRQLQAPDIDRTIDNNLALDCSSACHLVIKPRHARPFCAKSFS